MRSTITAVIILSILVTIWLFSSQQNDTNDSALTHLQINHIQQITLIRNDNTIFTLKKSDNDWKMTTPIEYSANTDRVNRLLQLSSISTSGRFPATKLLLDKLGFRPNKGTFIFNDTSIEFGNTESINHKRYVKIDEHIYLTRDLFLHQLMANPADFIDTYIIPRRTELISIEGNMTSLTDADWSALKAKQVTLLETLPEDSLPIIFNTSQGALKRRLLKHDTQLTVIDPNTKLAWIIPTN